MSDLFQSFDQFEASAGARYTYASAPSDLIIELKKRSFPDFYLKYIEAHGLCEFNNGFWWFTNPLDLVEDLEPFTELKESFPIIRNAFGCFLIFANGAYHHLNIHTKNFGILGEQLGVVFNLTLTDEYALRDMFFSDFFDYAVKTLGRISDDEIYSFVPALAIGGEVNKDNIRVAKLREHLHFLAQI